MNKAELVAAIAQCTNLSKSQARDAVEAFADCVGEALKTVEEVRVVGFGAFVPIARPAGPTRNPRTGRMVNRPASTTVRFRMGEALKRALN